MVQGLPHDIYSIQPYVRPLWMTVVMGILVAGLLGMLVWGFYRWYRRHKSYVPPKHIKDSWELLDDELGLLEKRLAQEEAGEIRELFYGLSLVLRRALELTSGIRATDLTVQEIKARLKVQSGIRPDLVIDIVTFLTRADLIKFADAVVESGESPSSYRMVKDWVLVLKPRPQIPMPSESLKAQDPKGKK